MKNAILFVLAICISVAAQAQHPIFTNVSLQKIHNREMIRFTTASDVNVRHYRIEAGTDSSNLEVIAIISSKGNSMKAASYSYDLTAQSYNYYRVAKVEMNGNMSYSTIITRTKISTKPYKQINPESVSASMIANR